MNIYQSISAPDSNGDGNVFLIPNKEKFLVINASDSAITNVSVLGPEEIGKMKGDFHYFDIGQAFNLLPKLSLEMIDEKALIEFLGWDENRKVYQQLEERRNIIIHFQTEPVSDISITQSAPSTIKHHLIEAMISICVKDGVHAMIYQTTLFVVVRNNDETQMCNCFKVSTDEEVMYYLLLLFQELNLSQEETAILFYGNFPDKPEHTEKHLSTYIRNVELRQFEGIDPKFQGIVQLFSKYHANH